MTLKQLTKQIQALAASIDQSAEQLYALRSAAQSPAIAIYGDSPRGCSGGDKVAAHVTDIIDATAKLEGKMQKYVEMKRRLADTLAALPDTRARQICQLRYIDGLSWRAVAAQIGGDCSAAAARKQADRLLQAELTLPPERMY